MPYHENWKDFFEKRREIQIDGMDYALEDVYRYFKERLMDEMVYGPFAKCPPVRNEEATK